MNSILIGREKKEETIKRHTKLRSAVYSNSLAMTYQKMGVITTENRCDYISVTFFFKYSCDQFRPLSSIFSNFEFWKMWKSQGNPAKMADSETLKLKITGVFFLINRHTAFYTLILHWYNWRLSYHISIVIYIFFAHKLRIKQGAKKKIFLYRPWKPFFFPIFDWFLTPINIFWKKNNL